MLKYITNSKLTFRVCTFCFLCGFFLSSGTFFVDYVHKIMNFFHLYYVSLKTFVSLPPLRRQQQQIQLRALLSNFLFEQCRFYYFLFVDNPFLIIKSKNMNFLLIKHVSKQGARKTHLIFNC